MTKRTLLAFALLILPGSACSSRLTIDVAVYKGPLVHSEVSRWARAAGLARAIAQTSAQASKTVKDPHARQLFKQLVWFYNGWIDHVPLKDLGDDGRSEVVTSDDVLLDEGAVREGREIEGQGIEELLENCLEVEKRELDGTEEAKERAKAKKKEEIAKLSHRIIDFTTTASAICVHLGVRDTAMGIFASDNELVRVTASIDETAKIAKETADSVLRKQEVVGVRDDALGELSAYMASQAPGNLMSILQKRSSLISEIYDQRYWSSINTVRVNGTGDTQYMLIKDEIGNWHLKKAQVDPSKVINAISAGTTSVINIAAAASGIPLKLTAPHVVENQHLFDEDLKDAIVGLGNTADDILARDAMRELRKQLIAIRDDHSLDEKARKERIQSAFEIAKATMGG